MLKYTDNCFRANNVNESCISRFIELIEKIRFLIVFQDEVDLPLWEKINYAGRFDPLVSTFVDKLARDSLFSEYFAENMMMKHMIHQIVTTFFAQTAQRN